MNALLIKASIVAALLSGLSAFMFKAGGDACKAKYEKASDKQFNSTLDSKQGELDEAIKTSNEWRAKVAELQKRKKPKVQNEKNDISNNNLDCDSLNGFGVFWHKLQEKQSTKGVESN